ncbi:hypothetical protein DICPUDRAFT_148542 [Dictyostelium purpureum]|uniref:Rab GTPase n=1 Tax=Dictyostelium purpureum TaxID=5786 RepID=F0ZBE2_DICPU|nr:uncharacterized protein DICPUDRAFT_148542 [Dictyostelium purpureum]EGC38758.1 hypothetical protein DICPUDRAFT_148542 [Dictyostelium purpureum]|eukprot:XP_003284749.1 hypothetical protein DICPUDRAFT_148542 [Dictyostelium purpureum]
MEPPDYNYLFKIFILGDTNSGKTCYLDRLTEDNFTHSKSPTYHDFRINKIIFNDNCSIKLQLWDGNANLRFRTIYSPPYRGTHGIILTYDICDRNSFLNCKNWYIEAKRYINDGIPMIIIGTKLDKVDFDEKKRQVTYDQGKTFAQELGLNFYEISSKYNIGIRQTIMDLIGLIIEDRVSNKNNIQANDNNNNNNNKPKNCTIQ